MMDVRKHTEAEYEMKESCTSCNTDGVCRKGALHLQCVFTTKNMCLRKRMIHTLDDIIETQDHLELQEHLGLVEFLSSKPVAASLDS